MIMKIRTLLFISFLLLTPFAKAQFTSVTGTVTDLDSQTWNNGTWSVALYNQYPQSPANINGTPLTPSQLNQSGAINGSGALSLTLADNSIVAPSGTYWVFTLCPNASAQCVIVSTPVSGTSQDIGSILSANLKGPRFSANIQSGGAWGYLDAEISPRPNPGGQYYNVITGCQRVWSGSAWSCLNTGSGFTLQVNGTPVSSPVNFANSASVTFSNPSGSVINAAASATAAGCVPTGSAGPFLINNGSGTCTNGPVSYNSGTGALTTNVTSATRTVINSETNTAGAFNFNSGLFTVNASGVLYNSIAGIALEDTSSSSVNIHETGTSSINITSDIGAVNLTGTTVNANGSNICTQSTGCPSSSNGTDYYWTFTTCANLTGQPSQCLGTASLPGNMPDANYTLQCSVNSSGVSNQLLIIKQDPLPTGSGSSISYAMVQVMQNGTTSGHTFNAYCHAHHN